MDIIFCDCERTWNTVSSVNGCSSHVLMLSLYIISWYRRYVVVFLYSLHVFCNMFSTIRHRRSYDTMYCLSARPERVRAACQYPYASSTIICQQQLPTEPSRTGRIQHGLQMIIDDLQMFLFEDVFIEDCWIFS